MNETEIALQNQRIDRLLDFPPIPQGIFKVTCPLSFKVIIALV